MTLPQTGAVESLYTAANKLTQTVTATDDVTWNVPTLSNGITFNIYIPTLTDWMSI